MKISYTCLIFGAFFLLMIGCDHENSPVFNVDCNLLKTGILNYNNNMIRTEIEKMNLDLFPSPSGSDETGQHNNLEILIARINRCDEIMAEEFCYACIKTFPAQSEILITIDSSGTFVKRIIDIKTPGDTLLQFAGIHQAYPEDNIVLQKTDYLGCFPGNFNGKKKAGSEFSDTLFYQFAADTMRLSVLLNYNCCGALTDSVAVKGNNVNIYISDTCSQNCICKCMCDFDLEYYFSPFNETEGSFTVYLKSYKETDFTIWKKTDYHL